MTIEGHERHRFVVVALDLQFLSGKRYKLRGGLAFADDDNLDLLVVDRGNWFGGRTARAESEDEIADRHHDRAEFHGTFRPEIIVRNQPADERGQVNQCREPAIEAGRCRVAEQKMIGEIEREDRSHPVITKAFPHFGCEQSLQLTRVFKPCVG